MHGRIAQRQENRGYGTDMADLPSNSDSTSTIMIIRRGSNSDSIEPPSLGRDAACGCCVVSHGYLCGYLASCCGGRRKGGWCEAQSRLKRLLGAAGERARARRRRPNEKEARPLLALDAAKEATDDQLFPVLPRVMGIGCPACICYCSRSAGGQLNSSGEQSALQSRTASAMGSGRERGVDTVGSDGCLCGLQASPQEVLRVPWGYSALAADAIQTAQSRGRRKPASREQASSHGSGAGRDSRQAPGGILVAEEVPLGTRGVPLSVQTYLGVHAFGEPYEDGADADADGVESVGGGWCSSMGSCSCLRCLGQGCWCCV